jgi:cystathionine gamma-synthase
MHSGTKYFGGHSDVLLGLVTASPWTERGQQVAPLVRQVQLTMGGVASPMDSWLTLRGMRTLHLRVERQCQTAMTLAKHLYHCMINGQQQEPGSPLITAVHYPGLESHPNHAIAQRQMTDDGFGGVLSIEFATEHLAMAFCGAVQTMYRATSLGGTETLVEHRASIEPPHRVVSPLGLVRMSVGLEDATDLIQDLDRALAIVQQIQQEMRQ